MNRNEIQTKINQLNSQIASLDNEQMAIKLAMNSLFGAMANVGFRFFDNDVAEAITSTGQLFLRTIDKVIDKELATVFNIPDLKCNVYNDTDSIIFSLVDVMKKYCKDDIPVDRRIKMMEKVAVDKIVPVVNKICHTISDQLNVYEESIFFKLEMAATAGIWVAPKRYICKVYSSEGVTYSKPKYKIKGLELVRSSTPKYIKQKLRDSLDIIFSGDEKVLQQYIIDAKKEFMQCKMEDVAFPRGVNGIDTYIDKDFNYKSGTPIGVRAVAVYNKAVKKHKLQKKYDYIREGNKIKFIYLKIPNTIRENVIGFPVDGNLPVEFDLHKYIDWDLQFEKTLEDGVGNIIKAMGWNTKKVETLDDFF